MAAHLAAPRPELPRQVIPLPVRDRLYALFAQALDDPEARAYLEDRLPRYERALSSLGGRPGPLAVWTALFKNGLYFDAHEYLERSWRKASGRDREVLRGLIQAAAAFHKLELDPGAVEGARWLLHRALRRLPR